MVGLVILSPPKKKKTVVEDRTLTATTAVHKPVIPVSKSVEKQRFAYTASGNAK